MGPMLLHGRLISENWIGKDMAVSSPMLVWDSILLLSAGTVQNMKTLQSC
jgi:hypothetical protein